MEINRVKISVTDACNLGCTHCYLNKKNSVFLDKTTIKNIIDSAVSNGVSIIDITGGEPTVHPAFIELIEYVLSKNFEHIFLSTNGLNLVHEPILNVIRNKRVTCHISMDGVSEQQISMIRGVGVFTKLTNTFSLLKSNGIAFSLRFSLNAKNYMYVDEMIEYAEVLGVNVSFGATQLIGHANKELILDNNQFEWVAKRIYKKKGKCNISIEECFSNYCPCDGACMDILSINHYGNPVGCLMIGSNSTSKRNVRETWDLQTMLQEVVIEKNKLNDFKITENCYHCEYLKLCQSGCFVTAVTKGCISL